MIQMTEPIAIEATIPVIPMVPVAFKIIVVISSVAIAIPDTGLLELPTIPTILDDTVAKKNPKITIIIAPRRLTGTAGTSHIIIAMIPIVRITIFIGISLLRRLLSPFPLLP